MKFFTHLFLSNFSQDKTRNSRKVAQHLLRNNEKQLRFDSPLPSLQVTTSDELVVENPSDVCGLTSCMTDAETKEVLAFD